MSFPDGLLVKKTILSSVDTGRWSFPEIPDDVAHIAHDVCEVLRDGMDDIVTVQITEE